MVRLAAQLRSADCGWPDLVSFLLVMVNGALLSLKPPSLQRWLCFPAIGCIWLTNVLVRIRSDGNWGEFATIRFTVTDPVGNSGNPVRFPSCGDDQSQRCLQSVHLRQLLVLVTLIDAGTYIWKNSQVLGSNTNWWSKP